MKSERNMVAAYKAVAMDLLHELTEDGNGDLTWKQIGREIERMAKIKNKMNKDKDIFKQF